MPSERRTRAAAAPQTRSGAATGLAVYPAAPPSGATPAPSSCRGTPPRPSPSAPAMQPGQQPYYNQDPWGAQQYAQAPQQAPQAQGFFVPQQVRAPSAADCSNVRGVPIHHTRWPPRSLQPAVYGAAAAAPPAQQHGGYAPGPAAPAAYGGGYPTSPSAYAGGGQPGTFVPPQPQAPQPGGGFGGMESDFLSGVAGNVLRQQGQSYLQRGQAFVQVRAGALGAGAGWEVHASTCCAGAAVPADELLTRSCSPGPSSTQPV